MKKHILIVSQYFYPENFRVNDLAVELYNRGYEVTVLTGIPNYPSGNFFKGYGYFSKRKENYGGVNIIRIPIIPRKNSKLLLALNYISFVISGYVWSFFSKLKLDYIFIYEVSPMTQALPAIKIAKKNHIPCYIYVTDLWPESVEVVLGLKNKFILTRLNKMVDYIYKNCNMILTSSRGFMGKIVSRNNSYEHKIMFWPQYAESFYEEAKLRDEQVYNKYFKDDGSFKVLFAGNVGEAQGLDILVKVALKLKESNVRDVKFYVVGNGRYKHQLQNNVAQNNIDSYFVFIESQLPQNIKYFMYEVDASLICLTKSEIFSMTIPAKTQSCLACGKPILVSADGEVQEIITEAKCGLSSDSGDWISLYDNILKMKAMPESEIASMSQNAIEFSQKYFNKNKLMEELDDLFK
ncbi:glycosyltransferase family 4 protein [Francisella frigiditurris]|uniref:Glycosyl transferases group 1 family protein n=1 Tax=Francisella frigiditurris TaxID=1542390 RepID=A0A1J0KVD8_9GAMM|nr:glycosyltransferase family 4 protein [Francisella frigiditurris]APC97590.1 glycosyl transferases group 1 family protein [Francisella frigiditurris]